MRDYIKISKSVTHRRFRPRILRTLSRSHLFPRQLHLCFTRGSREENRKQEPFDCSQKCFPDCTCFGLPRNKEEGK